MSRPFGVALLIAGVDKEKGPQLYHAEPSGTFIDMKLKPLVLVVKVLKQN